MSGVATTPCRDGALPEGILRRSGKSTLRRCLNRLEDATSGPVRVDGVDMLDARTDIDKARQRIGMVFQSIRT